MLYSIILKLKLTTCLKITIYIKEIENHKSFFINYISDVLMCIKNVKVFQFFLIEKKNEFLHSEVFIQNNDTNEACDFE